MIGERITGRRDSEGKTGGGQMVPEEGRYAVERRESGGKADGARSAKPPEPG